MWGHDVGCSSSGKEAALSERYQKSGVRRMAGVREVTCSLRVTGRALESALDEFSGLHFPEPAMQAVGHQEVI